MKQVRVMLTVLMLWAGMMLWAGNGLADESHFLLGVDGMSCPFCAYGIEKQLNKIDGVENVTTNLSEGEIWVEAASADVLSEDTARALLKDAGFTLRSFEVHQGAKPESDNS